MTGVRSSVNLEFNYANKDQKIKISPVGEVAGIDGRVFLVDGAKLIEDVKKNDLHVVLDENHWDGRAQGWFDKASFELKEDGIYASLELTESGSELVSTKAYRYLSPTYMMSDNRTVVGLDSVGLVNRPNLLNKELNKKDVSMEELEKLKAENETLRKENEELKKVGEQSNKQETEQKLEQNKDDVIAALTKQVEELVSSQKEMNAKISVLGGRTPLDEGSHNSSNTLTDSERAVAKQLSLTPEKYLEQKNGR